MSKVTRLLFGIGVALALSACAQTQAPKAPAPPPVDQAAEAAKAQMMQEQANVKVVEAMYAPGVTMADRTKYMGPNYIDHQAVFSRFAKLNGITNSGQAIREYFQSMQKLNGGRPFRRRAAEKGPKPPAANMLYKVVADGNMVTVIHQEYRPVPGMRGKFYPAYTFDAFRVQNGKLAEHWDGSTLPARLPILLREPLSKIHFPKEHAKRRRG